MASVLVIAADPVIESLVGELVAFAGHRPVYDATVGAAGEGVRRLRPNIVLLDSSLPRAIVNGCMLAAEEVGTTPILLVSRASATELGSRADVGDVPFFVLPGGPRPLRSLIDRTLGSASSHPVITIPEARAAGVHPAMCAALASVGRSQTLVLHAQIALAHNRTLRDEIADATGVATQSCAALKAAVVDYARQLKAARVPEKQGLELVANALRDCGNVVGAEDVVVWLLDESADWTREVYHAA